MANLYLLQQNILVLYWQTKKIIYIEKSKSEFYSTKQLLVWSGFSLGLKGAHLEAANVERSGLSFFLTSIYLHEPIA